VTIRVLVVDDEPPARRRLVSLLAAEADFEVVGEAGNGTDAIRRIEELEPAVVFLDVQMPELDGFGVLAAIPSEALPCVVFVTAYDEYAVQAFDLHAVDYLLKPFDRERFARTLERVRLRLASDGARDPRLRTLIGERLRARPLERVPVRHGARIRLVEAAGIDFLRAEDNYVRIHVGDRSYLVRDTLTAMEGRLDPSAFLRIHRSLIVNVGRVVELEPLFAGEFVLTLTSGVRLTSGRTYRSHLQEAFQLRS
jgi:two-component system, LytTR family, response regulator